MERRRALAIMLFFALLLSVVGIIAVISIETYCAQLSSLLRSDYTFSVNTMNPVLKDDYYQFDAGIAYAVSSDSKTAINAEILMQSINSDYTNLIDWNAEKLDIHEVAITEGIARANGLKVGDTLYSKHIVDGVIYEYAIKQILPEITSSRITGTGEYSRGIIIMGYDERYIENIKHKSIAFTNETLGELTAKTSGTPENIIYRTDEITAVLLRLLPYLLLFCVLSILLVTMLVYMTKRAVKYNFKRLAILGFRKRDIDSAYKGLMYTIGILAIFISTVIVVTASRMFVFSFIEAVVLLVMIFIELAALLVSARLSGRQLWR